MWPSLLELVHDLDRADEAQCGVALEQVLALAHERPKEFASAVREVPLETGSPLFWIYEAISLHPEGWESFIESEVSRALEAVSKKRFAWPLYFVLGGLTFPATASARKALTDLAISYSASPSRSVRRFVVNLLGDNAEPNDQGALSVLRRYRHDPDWRVRVEAAMVLNEDRSRPFLEGVGVLDRLRKKFASPTKW